LSKGIYPTKQYATENNGQ